jgi:hypothetical protein
MKSYDYSHRSGVKQLGWDDFSTLPGKSPSSLNPITLS